MPDRIVDKVRQRLEQEVAVAHDGQLGSLADECDLPAVLLRVRLVEFDRVARDRPEIHRHEPFRSPFGLHPGNPQQGRECHEETIRLVDGGLHRLRRFQPETTRIAQLLQPGAKPRERGLEVVRDVVGHPPDPVHELLDPVKHRVELPGELVEIVTGAAGRNPAREIAAHDLPARPVDRIDPAHRAPAHRERAGHREEQGKADAPHEGELDAPARLVDLVHVASHEKQQSAGKGRYPGSCEMRRVVRLTGGPQRELDPALGRGRGVGPSAHVAGERAAAGGREDIDERPAGTASHPILQHPRERRESSPAVPGSQALDLPFDGRIGFHLEVHRRRPVDEAKDHADRALEQQEVHHGEAECRAAKVPAESPQSPGFRIR